MKQIKLDDKMKQDLISKFTNYLNNNRLTDNQITFTSNFNLNPENKIRPTIYIKDSAYLKMMLYIRDTDTEIAWHGTVERDKERCAYVINNVFLYPQKLNHATVETDQDKYNSWLENLPDEQFNNMRFQGHSHVDFAPSPSGTDLNYYNNILQTLPENDYYIFMIMNKKGETTFLIYDLAENCIYETEDIDVQIFTGDTVDLFKDIKEDKDKYCEKPTITFNNYGLYNRPSGAKEWNYTPLEPKTNELDINDYLEMIDQKYKNAKLNTKKGRK